MHSIYRIVVLYCISCICTVISIIYSGSLPQLLPPELRDTLVSKANLAAHGLTACLAPLVYFADWMQLVEFIEIWSVRISFEIVVQ